MSAVEPATNPLETRKSIFITGAASGIGKATALHFAREGWLVGLFDINEDGLRAVAEEAGPGNSVVGRLDVRDPEEWKVAMETFSKATGGTLNVLFNNAGVGRSGWFEDVPPETASDVIDINLKGVINGVYAGLPLLKNTPGARIINSASVAGLYGLPRASIYSASKFAVRGLTEALNVEFDLKYGVTVCDLMPWYIDTAILDFTGPGANKSLRERITEGNLKVYTPDFAAKKIWVAAHGKKTHYTIGAPADRLKVFANHFPAFVKMGMKARTKKQLEELT